MAERQICTHYTPTALFFIPLCKYTRTATLIKTGKNSCEEWQLN